MNKYFLQWLSLENQNNWTWSEFDMDSILMDIQNSFDNDKPMAQWTSQEVLTFILKETKMEENDFTYNNHLERFSCISGYIFQNLSEDHCKVLSNSNYIGEIIFSAKEKYNRNHPSAENTVNPNNKQYIHSNNNDLPVSISFEDSEIDHKSNRKRGRPLSMTAKLGKRSEKLWEFLLHLLRDSKTCPHLIRWENFEEGTFKFVQNDQVARLWGSRKKNENMTYEKFSRAMRYYYKSEVLLPVPGRRLVYKFGPQAKGWKNITPIN